MRMERALLRRQNPESIKLADSRLVNVLPFHLTEKATIGNHIDTHQLPVPPLCQVYAPTETQ